jgi:CDP-diacylglycerol--glycerol-3-phosphate 3-phosphatidyltransferase
VRTDLLITAAVFAVAILTMPIYAMSGARKRPDLLASSEKGTFALGAFVRDWFYWFLHPVDRVLLATRVSPTALNIIGMMFGALAGAMYAEELIVGGGWAVLLGGVADILDGRVARARGMASPRGAFLDSTLDRFAEFFAFIGLAALYRNDPFALSMVVTALGGSQLVSYTRARGESQGVLCKKGVMQRAERLMLLGFASLFDPAASAQMGRAPGTLLGWALAVMAVGTVGTSFYRTIWIAQRLPAKKGS